MFNTKTAIVVGAGGSVEVGLPTGSALQLTIAKNLDFRESDRGDLVGGDRLTFEALQHAASSGFDDDGGNKIKLDDLVKAAAVISRAMPLAPSIDNFINAHRGDRHIEIVGKIAITCAILDAEQNSKMVVRSRDRSALMDVAALSDTWFNRFMGLLGEDCPIDEVGGRLSSIAFVVFNYDRCIEHFLYHALQIFYNIPGQHAAALLQNLQITHPYGYLGGLSWEQRATKVDFGRAVDARLVVQLAKNIHTFTEGVDPTLTRISEARASIAAAETVLFLGFAFHRLNMKLLFDDQTRANSDTRCFATAYKMSDSDRDTVTRDLHAALGASPQNLLVRSDLKCAGLFDSYRRSLSL